MAQDVYIILLLFCMMFFLCAGGYRASGTAIKLLLLLSLILLGYASALFSSNMFITHFYASGAVCVQV